MRILFQKDGKELKYGKLFKFNMLILMLAVSAGLIFLTCAFLGRLPKNITVNGVEVGGRTPTEAAACVREKVEEIGRASCRERVS